MIAQLRLSRSIVRRELRERWKIWGITIFDGFKGICCIPILSFLDDSELEVNSESRDRLINAWERAATLNLTNCERRPPV